MTSTHDVMSHSILQINLNCLFLIPDSNLFRAEASAPSTRSCPGPAWPRRAASWRGGGRSTPTSRCRPSSPSSSRTTRSSSAWRETRRGSRRPFWPRFRPGPRRPSCPPSRSLLRCRRPPLRIQTLLKGIYRYGPNGFYIKNSLHHRSFIR